MTLCVNRFSFPHWLVVVTQAVLCFCTFCLHHCYVRTNESVASHGKLQKMWLFLCCCRRRHCCSSSSSSGAAEKGWTQPLSQQHPLTSLRLLSGPGSPKTRAFTLHCACYSSQHSTHGHVSVFIAPNVNFHPHHALSACVARDFFLISYFLFTSQCLSLKRIKSFYCLNQDCSLSSSFIFLFWS